MAKGMDAMAAGDGAGLVAALTGARDVPRMHRVLGGKADDNRWDVRTGRAVMAAADHILAQPIEQIDRFLPTMAIAASRAGDEALLARLKPLVAQSELAADLVTRSGCHAWNPVKDKAQSKLLWEVVRDCKLAKKTPYFAELAKHHAAKKKRASKR